MIKNLIVASLMLWAHSSLAGVVIEDVIINDASKIAEVLKAKTDLSANVAIMTAEIKKRAALKKDVEVIGVYEILAGFSSISESLCKITLDAHILVKDDSLPRRAEVVKVIDSSLVEESCLSASKMYQ